MRLNADPNYTVCSIDFLDASASVNNKDKTQEAERIFLFSGCGTVSEPYRFDDKDALAQDLQRDNPLSKYLPAFAKNLNSSLQALSFNKFCASIERDLAFVIDCISMANHSLFGPIGHRATLWVFTQEVTLTGQWKRGAFPLDSELISAFPAFHDRAIKHMKAYNNQKEKELKFGLVIEPLSRKAMEKREYFIARTFNDEEFGASVSMADIVYCEQSNDRRYFLDS